MSISVRRGWNRTAFRNVKKYRVLSAPQTVLSEPAGACFPGSGEVARGAQPEPKGAKMEFAIRHRRNRQPGLPNAGIFS